ncbi:hypothetical protein KIPB_014759, partial [Kipferlia bialata]
ITYIVVAGDYLLSFVPSLTEKSSRLLASCFTMFPLAFIPDLRKLGPVSLLALLSCVAITISMIGVGCKVIMGETPPSIPVIPGVAETMAILPWPSHGFVSGLGKGLPILSLAL